MFQAPPRRDYVSPFEPGRDRPQRAPRSQSFKTPDQNGGMFQAPSPARLRVPVRLIAQGIAPAPEENGGMFQAPPRRDYVSPFG